MKILTIIAHPDDETILAGGTLSLLARAGAKVYYLCATRGEGGELGEPPLCTREELGAVREKEMRCAVNALSGAGVQFLDHVDPLIGENDELHAYTEDIDGLVQSINGHIQRIQPEGLITHGSNGEYGHPAHKLTHQAVRKALRQLGDQTPLMYSFAATFPDAPRPRLANQDDPAHLVVDISPAFQQKIKAAHCHRTQNALFVRRSSKRAGRQLTIPEVLMKQEGFHRHHPTTNGTPTDDFAQLLKPWTR